MSTDDDRGVSLRYLITAVIRDRAGFHERYASLLAADIVAGLSELRGGEEIYVPRSGGRMSLEARDEAVRAAFNGRNRDEVCREFGISRSLFYLIIGGRRNE